MSEPRTSVRIEIGPLRFAGRLERMLAPRTCDAFDRLLPFRGRLLHSRWCGEAVWIPLGEADTDVGFENPTSFPHPGQALLYPGGASEAEVLLAYGASHFMSKVGLLVGNHFLTVVEGGERLPEVGRHALWNGAQDVLVDWW